jgi:hypothetical protein
VIRLPWSRRHPSDEEAARRGRILEARIRHAEDAALVAISEAQRAKARQQRLIRQNHLAPRIAAALRESR